MERVKNYLWMVPEQEKCIFFRWTDYMILGQFGGARRKGKKNCIPRLGMPFLMSHAFVLVKYPYLPRYPISFMVPHLNPKNRGALGKIGMARKLLTPHLFKILCTPLVIMFLRSTSTNNFLLLFSLHSGSILWRKFNCNLVNLACLWTWEWCHQ